MGFKVENFVKNLLKFGCEAWGFENTFVKALGTNVSEKKVAQIAIVTVEMKVEHTNTGLRDFTSLSQIWMVPPRRIRIVYKTILILNYK